jgi:ferredoxin
MLRALAAQLMGPAAAQHAAALHSSPLLHRLFPAALHAASSTAAAPAGRSLHSSAAQAAASPTAPDSTTDTITVTFVDKDGNDVVVQAPLGKSLLEVAHDNEIELEGACEGSLACSTCHVIVEDEDFFKRMPEATEDELDMLDLAFGLTETSRLGCQVLASKELDGLRVRLPAATRNFYVDGHTPKPH